MIEFVEALGEHAFLRGALLAGLLASVACGVVGSYVVARRISYIAGGIAHCVLGGMGAARYFSVVHGWEWAHPLYGALAAAILGALVIGWVSLRLREREDTVISAVWSFGMAVGVLFIWKTPGYNEDLMNYLFGNILIISGHDLWLLGILDVCVLAMGVMCYRPLLAVCFDEEYARLRGVSVEFYYLLLLLLAAVTVVVLVTVVGIILAIAMLTLPAAAAGQFSRTLWRMMVTATLFCAGIVALGLAASYGPNLPAGATMIVLACLLYALATFLGPMVRGAKKA
ncbi:MAG: High-affinity zinc uptake system membrane protein ZnuB [bacterium]|nr:High-affinity zinc uptake system membrane protein ZnuB [bacterium]